MNPEAWVVIIGAVTTLLGAVAGFIARSKIGDVIASGSKREETAVDNMAAVMKSMEKAQQEREFKLIGLQEKALETVGQMSGAIQSFTLGLQAHEKGMLKVGEQGHSLSSQILESVLVTQGDIREMAVMLTDIAANFAK